MKWAIIIVGMISLVWSIWSCSRTGEEEITTIDPVDEILAATLEKHGSQVLKHADLTFTFRDYQYTMIRDGGVFQYERQFMDKEGQIIRDVLTNDAFTRFIDGEETSLSAKKAGSYGRSVNSVIYFATLPLALEDPAVQPTYLGETQVKNKSYHQLKITFRQEGGGKDFEDEFVYWIGKEDFLIDYFAYNYQTDGGGARFRVAYNERVVEGVRFVDYKNYKPIEPSMDIAKFASLYEQDGLKEVSVIETANIVLTVD